MAERKRKKKLCVFRWWGDGNGKTTSKTTTCTLTIYVFKTRSKRHKIKYFRVWAEVPSKIARQRHNIMTTTTSTDANQPTENSEKNIYSNSVPFITINLPIDSTQRAHIHSIDDDDSWYVQLHSVLCWMENLWASEKNNREPYNQKKKKAFENLSKKRRFFGSFFTPEEMEKSLFAADVAKFMHFV